MCSYLKLHIVHDFICSLLTNTCLLQLLQWLLYFELDQFPLEDSFAALLLTFPGQHTLSCKHFSGNRHDSPLLRVVTPWQNFQFISYSARFLTSCGLFDGSTERKSVRRSRSLKSAMTLSASHEDEDQLGLPEMGFTSTKVNKESQPCLLVLSHWRLCIALHHYVGCDASCICGDYSRLSL